MKMGIKRIGNLISNENGFGLIFQSVRIIKIKNRNKVSGVGRKMGCQGADCVSACGGWYREGGGEGEKCEALRNL